MRGLYIYGMLYIVKNSQVYSLFMDSFQWWLEQNLLAVMMTSKYNGKVDEHKYHLYLEICPMNVKAN